MAHAGVRSALGFGAVRFALRTRRSRELPRGNQVGCRMVPQTGTRVCHGPLQLRVKCWRRRGAPDGPVALCHLRLGSGVHCHRGHRLYLARVLDCHVRAAAEIHKKVSKTELAYIQDDPGRVRWPRSPGCASSSTGKPGRLPLGSFSPIPSGGFIFLGPQVLNTTYGLTLDKIGLPLIIIYLLADVGSIGGGWLSSAFIKRGWSVNQWAENSDAHLLCPSRQLSWSRRPNRCGRPWGSWD